MRRGVHFLLIGLLLLGAIAPGLDALVECSQPCVGDDSAGGCTQDVCCSCCLHAGPAALALAAPLDIDRPSTSPRIDAPRLPLSADPRDLLHVPKSVLL
jgi:hypothetical protein